MRNALLHGSAATQQAQVNLLAASRLACIRASRGAILFTGPGQPARCSDAPSTRRHHRQVPGARGAGPPSPLEPQPYALAETMLPRCSHTCGSLARWPPLSTRSTARQAPVLIMSFCHSSFDEDDPEANNVGGSGEGRGLSFVLNRNRLNVALSRAQCLAVVVASPRLPHAVVKTILQQRELNLLCHIRENHSHDMRMPVMV